MAQEGEIRDVAENFQPTPKQKRGLSTQIGMMVLFLLYLPVIYDVLSRGARGNLNK